MAFWSPSTVAVTGANGFTGSHVCRELLRLGASVRALVKPGANLEHLADIRQGLEVVYGDVTDVVGLLELFRGVDYVINPAALVSLAEVWASPLLAVHVNSIGSYNVAFAAMTSGVKRLLQVSTCHVYGSQPDSAFPIRETTPPHPTEVYAVSKHAGEVLVRSVASQGFPVVISRAFAKYGPGQSTKYLIPNIIAQLLQGREVRLGDPRPTRDYCYITDVVRGYLLMLECGHPGEVYHLSSGVERTVADIYESVARECGIGGRVVWHATKRANDLMRQGGDSSKARQELGWQPLVGFEEGLRLTVEWWRERLSCGTLSV